jgi:solute carrier family 25 S-adenosylmethionine transporter 26
MRLAPLAAEILAGYVGGSVKTLAFYPLDTITTLRETRVSSRRSLVQLYAGLPLTLLGALPYAVVFHTAFWLCERLLAELLPTAVLKLMAGVSGAVAAALVGVPFECLKHRVQLGAAGYATPRDALASTLRHGGGLRGLYTGLRSTLARNIPYNALHFGLFELAVGALHGSSGSGFRYADALAGAFAGALTALLTTPLDLVNTRLQTQAMSASLADVASNFTGVGDALVTILAEEGGPPALFRGAGLRAVQYAPSALVFFYVYGWVKRAV